jgi:hypothetical protein
MGRHPLDVLQEYFPAGTTEGERHILPQVFVYWTEYTELMTPPPTSPRVLVGKKGTGKTAVIDFYSSLLQSSGIPTLLVRPMDIRLDKFPEKAALGEASRIAYEALIRAIAARLGSIASGLLDEATKALHDEAVADGQKGRDFVEKVVAHLPQIARAFTKIDATGLLPSASPRSVKELQKALETNIERSGKTFYLFLDDTDQVAAPDAPGHLNRIWAFLLAAREVAQRVPQVRVIVSVREEVWRRLLRDAAGQRDQADHFLTLVRQLFPSREHIRAVLERRFRVAAEEAGVHADNPYDPFFEGAGAHMPSSQEFSSWSDLIVVRSRERPRDAIQLVNALARSARNRGADRIAEGDFETQIKEFSSQRVQLLAQEVEAECPQITDLVRLLASLEFDQGSFKISFEPLRQALQKLPTKLGITLFGRSIKPDDDDDALSLLGFFFEIGILNARVSDNRQKDGYRHVWPSADPRLVTRARWNELQGVVWEVHPAYRDHLAQVQREKAAQTGLPPRKRRERG